MRRKIIQACSFAVLLVLAGCVSIGPSNVDITDVAINRSLAVSRVNAYRASHGLPPLIHDSRLDQVSRDMAHLITRNDSMGTWQHSARGLSGRLNGASGWEMAQFLGHDTGPAHCGRSAKPLSNQQTGKGHSYHLTRLVLTNRPCI